MKRKERFWFVYPSAKQWFVDVLSRSEPSFPINTIFYENPKISSNVTPSVWMINFSNRIILPEEFAASNIENVSTKRRNATWWNWISGLVLRHPSIHDLYDNPIYNQQTRDSANFFYYFIILLLFIFAIVGRCTIINTTVHDVAN